MRTTVSLAAAILVGLSLAASAAPTYVDVRLGSSARATTATGAGLPTSFGPPEHFYAIFRLGPLAPGRRYELTMTYDAGTDIGFASSWLDGDPKGREAVSFVGFGSGTGTREMKGKEANYLFTVDSRSTSAFLYLPVRSNKPWGLSVALADRLSGVTPSTQDGWGYTYVTDMDAGRISPFLLTRGPAR